METYQLLSLVIKGKNIKAKKHNISKDVNSLDLLKYYMIAKKYIKSDTPIIFVYDGNILKDDIDVNNKDKCIIAYHIVENEQVDGEADFYNSYGNILDSITNGLESLMVDGSSNISTNIMNTINNMTNANGLFNLSSDNREYTLDFENSDHEEDDLKSEKEDESDKEEESDKEDESDKDDVSDGADEDIFENSELNDSNIIQQNLSDIMNMFNSHASINYDDIKNRYKDHFEHMVNTLGFMDEEKVLQSLEICEGNLENAINYYLS